MDAIEHVAGDGCNVVIDHRFAPLHIASWIGPCDRRMATAYFESHRRLLTDCRERGESCVLITDASRSGPPSAIVRKQLTDLMVSMPPWAPEVLVRNYVVLPNALLRGVLTALTWMQPALAECRVAATSVEALGSAIRYLRRNGIAEPPGLDPTRYVTPPSPSSSTVPDAPRPIEPRRILR